MTLWKGEHSAQDARTDGDRGPALRIGTDQAYRIDEERTIWIRSLNVVKPQD